jgi:hypothetical protein
VAGPHQRDAAALDGRFKALIFFSSLNPFSISPPLGLCKSMTEARSMIFKRNVPSWERGLRAACGVVLLVVAATMPLAGWLLWAVLAGGAGLLVSALAGFCPACALVGRRLT